MQSWLSYILRRSQRETRDMVLRRGLSDRKTTREDVALRYLRGDGIEIGALDFPLRLPRGAEVRYVDYLDAAGLREAYASTLREGRPLVTPDIVDDGARLASLADSSLDFVVANHMLEHVEDPIAALEHQLRVLRLGGVLYLTLPDARESFDAPRKRTTTEHLLRDHRDGPGIASRAPRGMCRAHRGTPWRDRDKACRRDGSRGSTSTLSRVGAGHFRWILGGALITIFSRSSSGKCRRVSCCAA
jgi:SAM-dependent methyltransferase